MPERRTKILPIRLTPTEWEQLQADAEAARSRPTTYLRERYFAPSSIAADKKLLAALTLQLSRVGNNLNQIAKRLHGGQYPEDLLAAADSTRGLFRQVLDALGKAKKR